MCKLEPIRLSRFAVDHLQMSQFMKEHIVKHQPTDRKLWPLSASNSAKIFRHLPVIGTGFGKSDAWRQRTQGEFASATIYIAESTPAPTLIVEMNCPKAMKKFDR